MQFTATAGSNTTIGYTVFGAASWRVGASEGACQGIYDTARKFSEADRRVGLMVFSGADVALKSTSISQITLKITTSDSGYSDRNKTLYLRKSNYQALNKNVTGEQYVGDLLGVLTGDFHDSTVTFTLNESTNADLFENLRQYFKDGNSAVVVFDESASHADYGADYTYNYLRISSCVLNVTYEEAKFVYRWNGEAWEPCAIWYFKDGAWVQCVPYYNKDGAWIRV